MTVVRDTERGVFTQLQACRTCGAPIYWSYSQKGRRAPFNVDAENRPTRDPHDKAACFAVEVRRIESHD